MKTAIKRLLWLWVVFFSLLNVGFSMITFTQNDVIYTNKEYIEASYYHFISDTLPAYFPDNPPKYTFSLYKWNGTCIDLGDLPFSSFYLFDSNGNKIDFCYLDEEGFCTTSKQNRIHPAKSEGFIMPGSQEPSITPDSLFLVVGPSGNEYSFSQSLPVVDGEPSKLTRLNILFASTIEQFLLEYIKCDTGDGEITLVGETRFYNTRYIYDSSFYNPPKCVRLSVKGTIEEGNTPWLIANIYYLSKVSCTPATLEKISDFVYAPIENGVAHLVPGKYNIIDGKVYVLDTQPPSISLNVSAPLDTFISTIPELEINVEVNESHLKYCMINNQTISVGNPFYYPLQIGKNNINLKVICEDEAGNIAEKDFSDVFNLYYFNVLDEKTLKPVNLSDYDSLELNILGTTIKTFDLKANNKTQIYFLTKQNYEKAYVKASQYGSTFTRSLYLRANNTFLLPNILRDTINLIQFSLETPCDGYLSISKTIGNTNYILDEQDFSLGNVKTYLIQGDGYLLSFIGKDFEKSFGIYVPNGNDQILLNIDCSSSNDNNFEYHVYDFKYNISLKNGTLTFTASDKVPFSINITINNNTGLIYTGRVENKTSYLLTLNNLKGIVYFKAVVEEENKTFTINKILYDSNLKLNFGEVKDLEIYKYLSLIVIMSLLGLGTILDFPLFGAIVVFATLFFAMIGWLNIGTMAVVLAIIGLLFIAKNRAQ